MTDGNGVELKGFGVEAKTNGMATFPFLLLFSFAITTGALIWMMDNVGRRIEAAIVQDNDTHFKALKDTENAQLALKATLEAGFIQTTRDHSKVIYNYQVDMCIRHIERTKSLEVQKWLWERWNNQDQIRVHCPWLGSQ